MNPWFTANIVDTASILAQCKGLQIHSYVANLLCPGP
jgi:hypothetical protein